MGDQPAIQTEGLSKRFGDVHALQDLNLTVPAASVLGLLGPNGAGKTTAVRILTTLLRPDTGSARVAGLDVVRQPAAVRQVIGLAGQSAAVDDYLTGQENLHMAGHLHHLRRSEAHRRAAELLGRFELTEAAERPVRTWSGGMRRRLDLAVSLVGHPQVLFLDEPSSGLDPRGRHQLWQTIRRLVDAGTAVLLTTQYLEEADQLAGQIVVIDRARPIRGTGHRPTNAGAAARDQEPHMTTLVPRRAWTLAISDTAVMTRRYLCHYLRKPSLLAVALVQPVLFVLLWTYVFSGAIQTPGGITYVDYLMPGLFILAIAFGLANTGVGLADDLGRGLIDRFRALALGGPTSGPLLRAIAWIVGILAVVIPLAIHRYRRVTQ